MTTQKSVEDLLAKYREEIFTPERAFTTFDLQALINQPLPEDNHPLSETNFLDTHLFLFMSFGQYLYESMHIQDKNPLSVSKEIQLPIDQLNLLLEDHILPWDLNYDVHSRLEKTLALDHGKTKKVIEKHVIPDYILEQRAPSMANLAARSDKSLTSKERQKDLRDSLLKIALNTEENRRKNFILQF